MARRWTRRISRSRTSWWCTCACSGAPAGEHELEAADLFSHNEQEVFTTRLELAEKRGKSIHLAVAPATEKWDGILRAAQGLQSSTVAWGFPPGDRPTEEARVAGLAWEHLPEPRPDIKLEIYTPDGKEYPFYLGPHAPHLTPKEIELLHGIWLELSDEVMPEELHHHDVVHFALEHLRAGISDGRRAEIVDGLKKHLAQAHQRRVPND